MSFTLQVGKLRPQMNAKVRPWIQECLCPQSLLSASFAGCPLHSLRDSHSSTQQHRTRFREAWKAAPGHTARAWLVIKFGT